MLTFLFPHAEDPQASNQVVHAYTSR